jgi:hypothetical protein
MKYPSKLQFLTLTILILFTLVLIPKAEAKPNKPGMPYANLWSCLNLETNEFQVYILNDPDIPGVAKGYIGTMERFFDKPDNWVDWGNFPVGKTKVHHINYETRDSWVSSYNPVTKTWVVQGWYTLNRQEHINLGWICK